jgi:hypothetical protein
MTWFSRVLYCDGDLALVTATWLIVTGILAYTVCVWPRRKA